MVGLLDVELVMDVIFASGSRHDWYDIVEIL
jgi:hypothetical protein